MADRNERVTRFTWGFAWFLLVVICAPIVPLLVVARAVWRRRRGTLRPSRLAFMTMPGRWIFWVVAFVGSEGVALDMFANQYWNGVDEHVAGIVGSFVVLILGLILFADLVLRETVATFRRVVSRV